MRKALITTVAPSLSNEDIASRMRVLLESDPALAIALATQRLTAPARKASNARTTAPETETERANRCAQFDDYSARGKIVAFAISELGDKAKISLSEDAIATAIGLPVYKVRPALLIVEARLSDLHNDKFPLVSQIGYVATVEGERNEAKMLHFSRVAPVASKASKSRKSRKALAPTPVVIEHDENESE